MKIEKIVELPSDIQSLIAESKSDGFYFLVRLKDDFESGENQFDKHGETLVAVRRNGALIAIGGLNNQNGVARLRRFYVSKNSRRLGVGRALLSFLEDYACLYFSKVTLYTDTSNASQFYEDCGYKRVNEHHVSHEKTFA